ncbi:MAG: hypothetical protein IPJ03_09675 [Ignavibacteriales bacterium]|nr:hypothetical protein [Ignavibacteriales bacterium]
MAENKFRNISPKRTYKGKEFADYKRYKDSLAKDFNERCGYTDCPQFWFGGKRNFQIDHFNPKSQHPELETKYSNLVYTCSYVNRAKSDDIGNYIDPCDTDYNEHFYRDDLGNIFPKDNSESAKYMFKKLKLFLKRYGIIWMIDQLQQRMFKLQDLIKETDNAEAKTLFIEITMEYNDYIKYLRAEQ